MSEITRIAQQRQRKDRFSVYVDKKFRLSLSRDQLADSGLRAGDSLSDERIEELLATSEFGKALDRTFNFISYRMRSRHEVSLYLRRKKYDQELSAQIVAELERRRIIDDFRFAKEWVDTRRLGAARSRRQLQAELREKGMTSEIIEEVLRSVGEEDEVGAVIEMIENKGLRRRYDDERKLINHLAGKGFSYATIKTALGRITASS